jgi:hypothetical protein
MSKLTLGALIADARGSVGGVTFSKWKGTNYVRSKVKPANPKTAAQIAVRDAMTVCVKSWGTMIAGTKTPWNDGAKGKTKTGANMFTAANLSTEIAGNYTDLTPVDTSVPNISTWAAAAGAAGEIDVSWLAGDAAAGDAVVTVARKVETGALVYGPAAVVSDLTATVTGLESGESYIVYGYVVNLAAETGTSLNSTSLAG